MQYEGEEDPMELSSEEEEDPMELSSWDEEQGISSDETYIPDTSSGGSSTNGGSARDEGDSVLKIGDKYIEYKRKKQEDVASSSSDAIAGSSKKSPLVVVEEEEQEKETTSESEGVGDHDVEMPREIRVVPAARREDRGSKKYAPNKVHACWFCHRTYQNTARHYETVHGDELHVAKLSAWPKNSRKRRDAFADLNRAGDFRHNCEVLMAKDGELILIRRPTLEEAKTHSYRDYGPCPNCLGFLLKKHMWHHIKNSCTRKRKSLIRDELVDLEEEERDDGQAPRRNNRAVAESNAILNEVFGVEFTEDFNNDVLSTLRDDDIGRYCREDDLILRMGAMHYERRGPTHEKDTRQNMRRMARLAMALRKNAIDAGADAFAASSTLADYMRAEKFDEIVAATREICQTMSASTEREEEPVAAAALNETPKRRRRRQQPSREFDAPSLALKIGFGLRSCANILRGSALRKQDLQADKRITSFLSLMDLEWTTRISSAALSTLQNRKLNVPQLLPVTEDLIRLGKYLDKRMVECRKALTETPSAEEAGPSTSTSTPAASRLLPQVWLKFAGYVLCRIILFNKRRSGEAAHMTINDYASRPSWTDQSTEELRNTMTPFEKTLAERLVVVEIVGKKGNKVPVILTPETKSSVDLLLESRRRCQINALNPYVFSTSGEGSMSHLRGHDVLRRACEEAELRHPEYVTGTKLRKYVATVAQVFDLTENETDWLARHLGHDIRVHRKFYRLHESAVEVTKISRLLFAIDKGEAAKYAGKRLQDINNDELPAIPEYDAFDDNVEIGSTSQPAATAAAPTVAAPTQAPAQTPVPAPRAYGGKRKGTKRPWTFDEKKRVLDFFDGCIRKKVLPGKAKCLKCIKKYPKLLGKRRWSDLKCCVQNELANLAKLEK